MAPFFVCWDVDLPIPTSSDAAKLAQEQSTHLHLCYLVHDLTQQFGAVIRPAKVVGVLDSAFDVVVVSKQPVHPLAQRIESLIGIRKQPEFGIEKRVHADKMPLDNHVYDEHKQVLS
jgi:protein SSD1